MSVHKRDYVIPSALLSDYYNLHASEKGFIADKVEHIVQDKFYRALELNALPDKKDRQRIAKTLKSPGCVIGNFIYWAHNYIFDNKLDINALDEKVRAKSVDAIKKLVDEAAEAGANAIGIVTGDNVSILERSEAYRQLIKSMQEICKAADAAKLNVVLQPMDRFGTKNKLLGLSHDIVELLDVLKADPKKLTVSYDSAHVALNHEGLLESLAEQSKFIGNIHLSNAVLDINNKNFGDNHMPPREPGFLNARKAEQIITKAWQSGIKTEEGLCVSVKYVQSKPEEALDHVFHVSTDFLKQVMVEFFLA